MYHLRVVLELSAHMGRPAARAIAAKDQELHDSPQVTKTIAQVQGGEDTQQRRGHGPAMFAGSPRGTRGDRQQVAAGNQREGRRATSSSGKAAARPSSPANAVTTRHSTNSGGANCRSVITPPTFRTPAA